MMSKVCILGVGRQGSAAAYDILLYAKPKEILLLDVNKDSINNCLDKIKKVISDKTTVRSKIIDLEDQKLLLELLKPMDIMLSSVPYKYNGEDVDIKITKNQITVYKNNEQITLHTKIQGVGEYQTNIKHYPEYKRFDTEEYREKQEQQINDIGEYALNYIHFLKKKWLKQYWQRSSWNHTFAKSTWSICSKFGMQASTYV